MKNSYVMNSDLYPTDHDLGAVVVVLREARGTNISIVELLMSLMFMQSFMEALEFAIKDPEVELDCIVRKLI